MLLGVFLLSDDQSEFIQALGLTDKLFGHRAAGWCVIMLSLSCLLAYINGRFSVKWYHAYHVVLESGASRKRPDY